MTNGKVTTMEKTSDRQTVQVKFQSNEYVPSHFHFKNPMLVLCQYDGINRFYVE